MADEQKKPAPGSFSKLMSPTRPAEPEKKEKEIESVQARKNARTHAPKHAPKRAEKDEPKEARIDASVRALIEKELKRSSLIKKHLSSSTFRFRPDELEELNQTVEEINKGAEQKISKNDVVRLALNWLLKDYEENKEKSMLARVLRRI